MIEERQQADTAVLLQSKEMLVGNDRLERVVEGVRGEVEEVKMNRGSSNRDNNKGSGDNSKEVMNTNSNSNHNNQEDNNLTTTTINNNNQPTSTHPS